MPKIKRKIKSIYMVTNTCSKCNQDTLRATGLMLASSPPKYEYRCKQCHHQEFFLRNERPGELIYEFEDEENGN